MTPTIIKPDWVGLIIPEPFEWCVIPAGTVTLKPGGYLKQKTAFSVPEFRMARYPITNAQFEVFVTADGGWRDAKWWDYSTDAQIWREDIPQSEPADFNDCADCPRETVSWYTAVAFTRWLSAKIGTQISLPTEQQWQEAAQGDSNRAYPWGHDWGANLCNSRESGTGKTTPVTQYPQGASPFGVQDMVGNVWEWCLTEWETGENDLNGTNVRMLRGGSWYEDQLNARAVSRDYFHGGARNNDSGFRVVCSSPIS